MRMTGTQSKGIRLPIVAEGDNLAGIVAESVVKAAQEGGFSLNDRDVVGATESIVARTQANYITVDDIAADITDKFGDAEAVGLVFPILSRNRFMNILKGVAKGCRKLYVLLSFPQDEVGNPLVDVLKMDEVEEQLTKRLYSEEEFRAIFGEFSHPFTGVDYVKLYKEAADNIEIYFANDPREILQLTPYVLDAEIHKRFVTKKRLQKAGAKKVVCLDEIMTASRNGSGYNADYGVLGSNIATDDKLKLFPRDCDKFVLETQQLLYEMTGKKLEVMVYGDGAFKDPVCGIWELADPVVSPGYTDGLNGTPNEIKLKFVADNQFAHLKGDEKQAAVMEMIKSKPASDLGHIAEGTTPRRYVDLLGSLCDLTSGSGDKGTPVVLIQNYFDDYAVN